MSNSYAASRRADSNAGKERTLSMVAGLLGLLMFVFGFFKWLKLGDGDLASKYGGYAYAMPTTAVIGLSVAAGLMALLGATERRVGRGVPSAVPTALAAASLLLAVGILLGKGSISSPAGSADTGGSVGVEIGLILGLVVALVQTVVLGMGLASRRSSDRDDDRRSGYNS